MASSETEICNIAIAHIGIGKPIGSLDERSKESNICSQFYDTARDLCFKDFVWGFATKTVELGLVEEDPSDEWAFSYRYPSDCLSIQEIPNGIRKQNIDTIIEYETGADDTGQLIYTDLEDATLKYTYAITAVEKWPIDFQMAVSYQLAALIAPTLAGVQRIELVKGMLELYNFYGGKAAQHSASEDVEGRQPESEWIRAREGVGAILDDYPRWW